MKISNFYLKTILFASTFLLFNNSSEAAEEYVKFIRVEATQFDNEVLIRWLTDSEFNNDVFTVQRAIDGGTIWQNIGTVDSYGNTPGSGTYEFWDDNPLTGSITYRIVATDYNGIDSYSEFEEIEITPFTEEEDEAPIEVAVYPNPSDGFVIIDGEDDMEGFNVKLLDITGKEIPVQQKADGTQIHLQVIQKTPGLYFLLISKNNRSTIQKIEFK